MTDVRHYLEHHDQPAFLFTPDAEFPLCNAEKGQFQAEFTSEPIEGGRILSWSGAEAFNAIPSLSVIELAADAAALPAPMANADRLVIEEAAPGRTRITAHGIGGHASLPEGTLNAIAILAGYLREAIAADALLLAPAEARFLKLMAYLLSDTTGAAAGVASSNDAFGPLTLNAGTIEVAADGRLRQGIDIRFPDSTSEAKLERVLSALAEAHGAALSVVRTEPPFSTSAESPAVRALIEVYNEVTGRDAKPFSMGGGTYARNFARAVSFGPEEPDTVIPEWGGPMHGPNEVASEELLKRAMKIYILAILRLNELEL